MLIRADEKRARTARRIDNPEFCPLFRGFVLEKFADRVLDDVIDDVGGRVINAARFLDFWFVFDFGLMAFGEPDDFAEKLLVNLTENIGWQNGKFVGAVWIIETPDDFLEDGIVDFELGREVVGRFDAIFFLLKIKQTGVVTLVGFAKELVQSAISVVAIQKRLQSPINFDT